MSDIDVEDVVDAVAPSEAYADWTRAVAVSLAFRDPPRQNDDEDDVQRQKRKRRQIERNRGVRQRRLF
jgi:hypothetical protein